MRNELEYLAQLEAYVLGSLNDKAAFEQKLLTDTELQQDVNTVKELVNTVKVQALRAEVNEGYRLYQLKKVLTYVGIVLAILLLATGAWLYAASTQEQVSTMNDADVQPQAQAIVPADTAHVDSSHNKPITTGHLPISPQRTKRTITAEPTATTASVPPDSLLPLMSYALAANKDEVIETPQGIIVSIPKNSWTLPDGSTVTGQYMLEIREALNPLDIMKAGLSTWAGKDLLETGGMFYINARQGDDDLLVMNSSAITVSVPKLQNRNDMLLFDGQRQADGSLDWVNPQPAEKGLMCVPMNELNFYPPHFETEVARLGYPNANKTFLDSVYLSFATDFELQKEPITDKKARRRDGYEYRKFWHYFGIWVKKKPNQQPVQTEQRTIDSLSVDTLTTDDVTLQFKDIAGINPKFVLAFWHTALNGTLLATHEFETRMRYIHQSCNPKVLECYTKNLDKMLYQCDSMAMRLVAPHLRSEFNAFTRQHLGRPTDAKAITPALYAYIAQKQAVLEKTLQATTLAWYAELLKKEQELAQTEGTRSAEEWRREAQNRQTEFWDNYASVQNQLGNTFTPPTAVSGAGNTFTARPVRPVFPTATRNYNTFRVRSTGWKNVDAYTREATLARKSSTFTDPVTGQAVSVTYVPFTFSVANAQSYPLLEAYLIPDSKLSFMRIKKTGSAFSESLSALYKYRLVVIGQQQNQWWAYTQPRVDESLPSEITLLPSTESAIQAFVMNGTNTSAEGELRTEINYLQQKMEVMQLQQQRQAQEQFRKQLQPTVFPCAQAIGDSPFP